MIEIFKRFPQQNKCFLIHFFSISIHILYHDFERMRKIVDVRYIIVYIPSYYGYDSIYSKCIT